MQKSSISGTFLQSFIINQKILKKSAGNLLVTASHLMSTKFSSSEGLDSPLVNDHRRNQDVNYQMGGLKLPGEILPRKRGGQGPPTGNFVNIRRKIVGFRLLYWNVFIFIT